MFLSHWETLRRRRALSQIRRRLHASRYPSNILPSILYLLISIDMVLQVYPRKPASTFPNRAFSDDKRDRDGIAGSPVRVY